ncbi:lysosome-associated membrane glycoprotein 1-like [Symsagittifera roscoffensis]|uniref:lysosome-associated membrane glycoprotein 1-like n=1 Tax=Symsagittifera roscoffensis TaxID=84072 RepID=UPI00307BA7DC
MLKPFLVVCLLIAAAESSNLSTETKSQIEESQREQNDALKTPKQNSTTATLIIANSTTSNAKSPYSTATTAENSDLTAESSAAQPLPLIEISTATSTLSEPITATTIEPNYPIPKNPVHNHIELRDPSMNSSLCFMADIYMSFDVHYNDTKGDIKEVQIFVPEIRTADAIMHQDNCSHAKSLKVPATWTWNEKTWNVNLIFARGNKSYSLLGVEVTFPNDPKFFPSIQNTDDVLRFENESVVAGAGISMGHMYKCEADAFIIVTPNQLVMKVSHLKLQAFVFPQPPLQNEKKDHMLLKDEVKNEDSNSRYSNEVDVCLEDKPESKLIPIIVGCVLAGLIALVLIAYVIASRRYKKYTGYETL